MSDSSGGQGPPVNLVVDEDDLPLNVIAQNQQLLQQQSLQQQTQQQAQHQSQQQCQQQQQGQGQPAVSLIDFNNMYLPTDNAPYIVFVEHEEKNLGRLFPVRVGHYLMSCDKVVSESIVDIKVVGINRVKVILKSYTAANALVNNDVLKGHKLISYIPKFCTQKKGVIKMVDTFFTEDYLLKSIESKCKVTEVKRLKRKVKDSNTGEDKIIDRQIVVVSFLGNALPREVRINKVNFSVEPYIHPVIQCQSCLRYGHTEKLCRGKPRCKVCGVIHDDDNICEKILKCVHCGSSEHGSLSRNCPAFLKQKSVKEIMAHRNVSFKEAEQIFKNPSYAKVVNNNRYDILRNEVNFPELPNYADKESPQSQPTSYHRPRGSSQKSSVSTSNKRKSSVSPDRRRKKDSGNSVKDTQAVNPVIPNPYRREFIEYRESLINQFSNFFVYFLTNTIGETGTALLMKNHNIKDSLSSYLINQDDLMDCDAQSEKSSY